MNLLQHAHIKRNHISTDIEPLYLIAELPTVPRVPTTAAGLHLHRHHHVSAGIADLIAALAGLGQQEAA